MSCCMVLIRLVESTTQTNCSLLSELLSAHTILLQLSKAKRQRLFRNQNTEQNETFLKVLFIRPRNEMSSTQKSEAQSATFVYENRKPILILDGRQCATSPVSEVQKTKSWRSRGAKVSSEIQHEDWNAWIMLGSSHFLKRALIIFTAKRSFVMFEIFLFRRWKIPARVQTRLNVVKHVVVRLVLGSYF